MAEVLTNGCFLPGASDNYDQSENAEENKKRQGAEETTEVGNSTSKTVESSVSPANIEEEKMEIRVQDDTEEKIGADKHTIGRSKLETIYDVCQWLQDSGRGGDGKQNTTNSDQECKKESSTMLCKIHEHQTEVTREETSTTKIKISFTHVDSDVEKKDKEPENNGHYVKIREDPSPIYRGSEGRGSLTEEQGTENTKLKKSTTYGKIIEEEIRVTTGGLEKSTETKNIKIETVGRTSPHNMKKPCK